LIIVKINVETTTSGKIEKVEFYIDEDIKHIDYNHPYSWTWDEFSFGRHKIKVVAYGGEEKAEDAMSVMKIL